MTLYESLIDLGRFRSKILFYIGLAIGAVFMLTSFKLLFTEYKINESFAYAIVASYIVSIGYLNNYLTNRFEIVAIAHSIHIVMALIIYP